MPQYHKYENENVNIFTRGIIRRFIPFLFLSFFWYLFDAIISYSVPILVVNANISTALMGFLYASSSVWGIVLDYLIIKYLKNVGYSVLIKLSLLLCLILPFLLWGVNTFIIFFIAMIIWGFYYDFFFFATNDFISREVPKLDHSLSYGLQRIMISLAYFLGPILGGILYFNKYPPLLVFIVLILCFAFFLILQFETKKYKRVINYENIKLEHDDKVNIKILKYFNKKLLFLLIICTLSMIYEAVFWTVGPLLNNSFPQINNFGGIIISLTMLPGIVLGLFMQKLTNKYGKKRTSIASLLISSLLITSLFFIHSGYLILLIVFISSIVNTFTIPAMGATFADYLKETKKI